jgi:hypothetical protein
MGIDIRVLGDQSNDPLWRQCEGVVFDAWRKLRALYPSMEDAAIYIFIAKGVLRVEVYHRVRLTSADDRLNESAFESLNRSDSPLKPTTTRNAIWVLIDNCDDDISRLIAIGWPTKLDMGSEALS